MQGSKMHLLTIEEQPVILKVLDTLSTATDCESAEARGTLKRLEEFAKEDCGRLLLRLRVVQDPPGGSPANVRSVGASLIGGVLVVTCQVTDREAVQIKKVTHQSLLPRLALPSLSNFLTRPADRDGWLGREFHALTSLARKVLNPPVH